MSFELKESMNCFVRNPFGEFSERLRTESGSWRDTATECQAASNIYLLIVFNF